MKTPNLASELQPITTKSDINRPSYRVGPNGAVFTNQGNVFRVTFPADVKVSRTRKTLSQKISEYEMDPLKAEMLSEGRAWIGAKFRDSGEISLKTLRLEAGLSQSQLAERCSTQQSFIARLESENSAINPSLETIIRLARALNADAGELAKILARKVDL